MNLGSYDHLIEAYAGRMCAARLETDSVEMISGEEEEDVAPGDEE